MADKQPLRATFYTLKKHGARGGVILGATLTTAALAFVLIGALAAACFPFVARLGVLANNAAAQVSAVFSLIGIAIVFLFAIYVLFAAYEAACLRWMIRREAPGLFGLTLGADTWRVYSGYWLWFFISLGVSMAVSIVMTPFMFFAMASMAGSSASPDAAVQGMLGMQILINVAYYAVMAFIGVRFAPAAATSIARRRFSFFHAWNVTRGRFWELFGSFLLLLSAYILLVIVFLAVVFGAVFSVAPLQPGATPAEVNQAFARLFTPQYITIFGGLYLLMLIVGIAYVVMSYGVNARAVIVAIDEGKIDGQTPNVAEVFD